MNDSTLKKISFFGSIIGIIFLYIVSGIGDYQVDFVQIKGINQKEIGSEITVIGFVDELSYNKGHLFLSIKDETGNIKIVVWNSTLKMMDEKLKDSVKRGKLLQIRGKLDVYNEDLEIIVNEMKVIEVKDG